MGVLRVTHIHTYICRYGTRDVTYSAWELMYIPMQLSTDKYFVKTVNLDKSPFDSSGGDNDIMHIK